LASFNTSNLSQGGYLLIFDTGPKSTHDLKTSVGIEIPPYFRAGIVRTVGGEIVEGARQKILKEQWKITLAPITGRFASGHVLR
jgi:hypothetical protein